MSSASKITFAVSISFLNTQRGEIPGSSGLFKYLKKILVLQEPVDVHFSLVSEKYEVLLELAFPLSP